MQNRLRSKYLWLGMAGSILMFLQGVGVIDVEMTDLINNILNAVCALLTAVGIFNNPTDSVNW